MQVVLHPSCGVHQSKELNEYRGYLSRLYVNTNL